MVQGRGKGGARVSPVKNGTGPIVSAKPHRYPAPMPRIARHAPGGLVYHVLNRGVGRKDLFDDAGDYLAFLRVFRDVLEETPMRVCGYCIMANHWHLVLWPRRDGDLARFMQRLT